MAIKRDESKQEPRTAIVMRYTCVDFNCPRCGQRFRLNEEYGFDINLSGGRFKCYSCEEVFELTED